MSARQVGSAMPQTADSDSGDDEPYPARTEKPRAALRDSWRPDQGTWGDFQ